MISRFYKFWRELLQSFRPCRNLYNRIKEDEATYEGIAHAAWEAGRDVGRGESREVIKLLRRAVEYMQGDQP